MIGLSKSFYSIDGENSGSAFLEGLYQSGQIDSKTFAIHFDAFGGSELELGGYSPDKIVQGIPLTFLDNPKGKEWMVTINAFRVGEKPAF